MKIPFISNWSPLLDLQPAIQSLSNSCLGNIPDNKCIVIHILHSAAVILISIVSILVSMVPIRVNILMILHYILTNRSNNPVFALQKINFLNYRYSINN